MGKFVYNQLFRTTKKPKLVTTPVHRQSYQTTSKSNKDSTNLINAIKFMLLTLQTIQVPKMIFCKFYQTDTAIISFTLKWKILSLYFALKYHISAEQDLSFMK
jgi:hypothetical protein